MLNAEANTAIDGLAAINPPIVLYDYKLSRSGSNAADYLKGFHGICIPMVLLDMKKSPDVAAGHT